MTLAAKEGAARSLIGTRTGLTQTHLTAQGRLCGAEVNVEPGTGPRDWDINHDPPWSQRTFPSDVTRPEVIDDYQQDTWLECPACNRRRGAG